MTKKKDKSKDKDKNKKKESKAVDGPGTFLAKVYVTLKPTVNDPEGITIGGALASLGFDGVRGVRSGKFFQVTIEAEDAATASSQVDQMCSRLLANPVIETYSFELVKPGK